MPGRDLSSLLLQTVPALQADELPPACTLSPSSNLRCWCQTLGTPLPRAKAPHPSLDAAKAPLKSNRSLTDTPAITSFQLLQPSLLFPQPLQLLCSDMKSFFSPSLFILLGLTLPLPPRGSSLPCAMLFSTHPLLCAPLAPFHHCSAPAPHHATLCISLSDNFPLISSHAMLLSSPVPNHFSPCLLSRK